MFILYILYSSFSLIIYNKNFGGKKEGILKILSKNEYEFNQQPLLPCQVEYGADKLQIQHIHLSEKLLLPFSTDLYKVLTLSSNEDFLPKIITSEIDAQIIEVDLPTPEFFPAEYELKLIIKNGKFIDTKINKIL